MSHFIGIDVHKKTSHVVVLDEARNVFVLDKNIRTKRERLVDETATFVPAKILIESSTLSRWVADVLREQGHEVIVGAPNFPLMYASRPPNRKNDREDARALAFACKAGHYVAVHRVSDEHRLLEELIGTRAAVVESRTMFVNRVRSLHAAAGLVLPSSETDSFWAAVTRGGLDPRVAHAVRPLLDMLAMAEDQLRALDARLEVIAANDPVARLLMTIPGVGPIVALSFIAILDTPQRFGSAHMLESYIGLVPVLRTSAGPGEGGHISKMGSGALRALLVQAAWSLMRSRDPAAAALQSWANGIAQRRPAKVAIIALARRLAGVMYALWRDGKPFELKQPKSATTKPPEITRPLVRSYTLKKHSAVAPTT